MSLDNTEVVDAVGTERDGKTVVLTILDSWDWENQAGHLQALQAKLNSYFGFVESGQIYEDYPDASGKSLRIDVIYKYPPPGIALAFLDKASAAATQLNMEVTYRMH